jgi:D-glycero-D-manno-heptose 1,7-bisphosphate phosphatase
MNKAVFLDRDGTINVEKKYLHRIKDFEFLPGVLEGMSILQHASFKLIVITNQSGIGRGYYTEEDLLILHNWILSELLKHDIRIEAIYYCPHLPNAKIQKYKMLCNCRKPAIGLYTKAIHEHNISIEKCWTIGDKIRDCQICEITECRGFLIGENEDIEVIEAVQKGLYKNVRYEKDLLTAAKSILET